MAKDLIKQNGKWIDIANGNAEFKGHVSKDLTVGDFWEMQDEKGTTKKMKIVEKKVNENGILIVHSMSE